MNLQKLLEIKKYRQEYLTFLTKKIARISFLIHKISSLKNYYFHNLSSNN